MYRDRPDLSVNCEMRRPNNQLYENTDMVREFIAKAANFPKIREALLATHTFLVLANRT